MAKPETETTDATETETTGVVAETAAETPVETAVPPVVETVAEEPVTPAPAEPATVAPAEPVRKGPGFGALVLGGVVAAVVGAGGAIYALPHLPPQLAAWIPSPAPDTSAFDAALAAERARIDSLAGEIAALKSATAPAPDLSGVQGALDEAAASGRALQEIVAGLDTRIVALESRPVTAVGEGPDATATAALQGQIDALRDELARAGSTDTTAQEQIVAAASAARQQIDSVQAEARQLSDAATAAAGRAVAQSAVARVAAAFEAGVPLDAPLADAEAAGLAVPGELKTAIPTVPALQAAFPEAARAALTASRKAAAGEGLGQRLGAFLMAQTGARSVTPREGDDPDAVLSRAQAAVDAGDLPKTIAEIGALPQAGQALFSGWITQAQTRIAAAQALVTLAQSVK